MFLFGYPMLFCNRVNNYKDNLKTLRNLHLQLKLQLHQQMSPQLHMQLQLTLQQHLHLNMQLHMNLHLPWPPDHSGLKLGLKKTFTRGHT